MDSTSTGSARVPTTGATIVDEDLPQWGEKLWDYPEPPGPGGGYPLPPSPAGGEPETPDDGADPPDSGGGHSDPRWDAPSPPPQFVVPGDAVTRQLCAAAHLSADFANRVHDELVEPAYQGVAPNWNLDAVALARHAEQSRQRRETRDRRLLAEFAGVIIVLLILAECALLGVFDHLRLGGVIALCVGGPLLVYAVAFAIVWQHYSDVRRSAVAVVGGPGVEAVEPAPLEPAVEQALRDAAEANVVLFSGQSPFVGSGEVLDHWTMSVDISTGPTGSNGEQEEPDRFDGLDLHEALLESLSGSISPRPVGGLRLYVVGGHALAVGGLFRHGPVEDDETSAIRFRRPVTTVPQERIEGYLRKPAASARPYMFFELTGWDGQVVVTLFVRSVVTYPMLFVETSVCALRPPRAEFGDVGTISLGPRVHLLPVLRSVLPMAIPLLLNSPARALSNVRGGREQKVARKELARTLARRADVNFAAGRSLRESVSSGGNGNHFGFIDEEMYYRMFNRRALDCLRDYLTARRVDVAEFDKQATVILEKTIVNAQNTYHPDATAGD